MLNWIDPKAIEPNMNSEYEINIRYRNDPNSDWGVMGRGTYHGSYWYVGGDRLAHEYEVVGYKLPEPAISGWNIDWANNG